MKELIEYIPLRLLGWLAGRLQFKTAGKVGAALGSAAFRLSIRRKHIALDNLSKAFPDLTPGDVRAIALGAFRNYGTAVLEFLWSDGQPADVLLKTARIADYRVVQKYCSNRRAVIFLSAHFGGWELLLKPVRLYLGRPMTSIVQHQRNKRIDRFVDRIRCQFDNSTVPMGIGAREVLKALKEGGAILMLGDQSGSKESLFIDFFGRPAATHRGAAAFSLKTNTPIVMVLLLRQADGTYEIIFEEVDRTGLDDRTEENVIELTRRHTALLERYIRMRPDHWLWMHRRWKHTRSWSYAPAEEPV
jgi:KDO2-lipid IV(A) lauroyltransferase